MNVALVEFNPYHDEILPTLVYALNALGAEPDVYVVNEAVRRNAFALSTGLRYRMRSIDGSSRLGTRLMRARGTPARHRRYDVLVMNSIEPNGAVAAASRIDLPTIAVVHNADRVQTGRYASYFADRRHEPIFLGRHVARGQDVADDRGWVAPVYLGEVPREPTDARGPTVLCVQGNVDYARRDYDALLDAVEALAAERSDFHVRVVGRSDSPDGLDLRARVVDRGVADRFTFNPREISYRDYLTQVGTSDFILPLVHDRVPNLARYLSVKITSSMAMSIGLGVIPIVDDRMARQYGVEAAAVSHGPDGFVDAIRMALALSPGSRTRRRTRLAGIRSEMLASSIANLGAALERLGA